MAIVEAEERPAEGKSAPTVSFVSLGCPKALVDSERILTQLRAEGYGITRRHEGADLVIVNTCGFLDSAKAESLAAIGEAMAENGKVIVTGCMGAEPGPILERFPDVFAVTGPQQYESVVAAVHEAAPPLHDPYHGSRAAAGPEADAAPLRLSEDFGGLQQSLQLLHHSRSCAAISSAARPATSCARPRSW